MKSLLAFLRSSIGKKVLMSLTGLFLCIFLVEHLVGNLLLLKDDGGVLYEAYAEFLVANPFIRTMEFVLFAALLGHALSGVIVWLENRRARPNNYDVYKLNENTPFASRITMVSGSVIFLFLVVHLRTFFVPTRLGDDHSSLYFLVQQAFSNAWYSAFYILALVVLGYHLRHGFQSAFQTLGIRGKRYEGLLNAVAFLFWFVIPLGFAIIPVYFYFFRPAAATAVTMGVL
ncbi:MAG: succinate dehydrogenase cytochrome b subunit [Bacteroidota bacterium]